MTRKPEPPTLVKEAYSRRRSVDPLTTRAVMSRPATVLILDTNVVLDLFYFQDRRCAVLAAALADARCRWIASAAMRDEIEHVLARGLRGVWPGNASTVTAAWARCAAIVEADGRPAPPGLRCTDADDQKFIDLALQVRACALLSADRAVLRLARHGRVHGLEISTVERWTSRMS